MKSCKQAKQLTKVQIVDFLFLINLIKTRVLITKEISLLTILLLILSNL
nr:MAG TPA: hypothetical protein [Caudoviricetes sp.]